MSLNSSPNCHFWEWSKKNLSVIVDLKINVNIETLDQWMLNQSMQKLAAFK